MLSFLCNFLIVFLTSTILIKCADEHEALHFSRNKLPHFTIDKKMREKTEFPLLLYPTATACPVNSHEEDAFSKQYSFGKKSLFVRHTYEGGQAVSDVNYYICENPYKMSILYHAKDVQFQFGFEIFYDKSEFGDKGFLESNRGDYDLITNTYAFINYIKPFFSSIPGLNFLSRSKLFRTALYLDKDRKREMGFMWRHSFVLNFNFKAKRVAQSTYGLSLTTRGFHNCDDYDLGKEFFDGLDIEDLYRENNQKRMLMGVELPKSKDIDEYKEVECESENKCFIKWSTVPAEQFHHLATKPTSCSDLTTVPVWKSTIYDVLNKLDNFLFAISMVIGHPVGDILVHSGVHGTFQLPTEPSKGSLKTITLADTGIEVPSMIYKFVKYKTKVCQVPKDIIEKYDELKNSEKNPVDNENDELKVARSEPAENPDSELDGTDTDERTSLLEGSKKEPVAKDKNEGSKSSTNELADNGQSNKFPDCKWSTSAIIVVIHNNPNFNPETDKICNDLCAELGWNLIKFRKIYEKIIISKYIYCCSANDDNVREKLGIKRQCDDQAEGEDSSSPFSLKSIPIPNSDTDKFELRDIQDLVVKTYEKLFEGAKFELDEKDIWRLIIPSHHVKMSFFQIEELGKNEEDGPDDSEIKLEGGEETEILATESINQSMRN